MRKPIKTLLWVFLVSTLIFSAHAAINTKMLCPKTNKDPYERNIHNDTVTDNYHWLRDASWPSIKNDKIIKHLKKENQYTKNYFSYHTKEQGILIKEIKSKIIEEDSAYPVKHDNYYYYRKFIKGKNNFVICRKKNNLRAKEEELLDINKLATHYPGFRIGSFFSSPNYKMFAYSADLKGEERYSISVKNLDSGKTDSNVVNDAIGAIVWDRNSKGFFYVKLNDQRRSTKVYYHELGKSESQDRLVYKEEDETFPVNIRKTSDNKYLIINSYSNEGNEIRILNIENEKLFVPKVLIIRRTGQFYDIDHGHESFYLKINDKGKNFRLVKLKGEKFNKDNAAIELIPHKEKQYIGGFSLSKDYLVVNVRTNGVNNIIVLDKYGESKEIKFNEDAYNAYGYYPTYKSEFVRISYESFITPPSILEYDFSKNKIYTRKEKKVLGGYNKEQYKSEKIYINAGDGTKVPVSLFYRKDLFKKDGTNPLLLYGYGSYGISQYPSFNTGIFSLIDRGFVYAIAHIRGGSELGFKWYEGAKLLNKKRTFLDYINCAEELIKKKYADPKRIVGYGVSAGGMLLGYVINERPELLRAVVTDVPFVDVLNFLLDDTLPTTPFHFKELGNPKEKKYYDYIKSYSPYDNIKLQRYPAIYATAGLQDRRVAYWQPVKWIAKLREHNQSNNPVLLCIDMTSGHFGKSGRYDDLKKRVLMYNFILLNTGISLDQKQPF